MIQVSLAVFTPKQINVVLKNADGLKFSSVKGLSYDNGANMVRQ